MMTNDGDLKRMLGRRLTSVDASDESIVMRAEDGALWRLYVPEDCCNRGGVEDICGDLADLIDSPITLAEEVSNPTIPDTAPEWEQESHTWTFYRFGTAKGVVVVRFFGTSNGYYAERADVHFIPPEEVT